MNIALHISGRQPGLTSLYTQSALRREARALVGRDIIVAMYVNVHETGDGRVQLVVEHQNRKTGLRTVSRSAL